MGMFDNILVKCNNCGEEAISQTKLSGNNMFTYEIGDKFYFENCVLGLKDKCKCGARLKVKIYDNVLLDAKETDDITIIEEAWGEYIKW